MNKSFYIFTDAHISGLVAIIAQGKTLSHAKLVAVSSRTTNMAEKKYPQLDLEAMAINFALRILAGAPDITILTNHKPLCATFNRKKTRLSSNGLYEVKAAIYCIQCSISER